MKTHFTYLIFLLFVLFSCDKPKEGQMGYTCIDGNCVAVYDDPEYFTLEDCLLVCGKNNTPEPKPGSVSIYLSFNVNYGGCIPGWTVVIGLGYSSTDIANDAFFCSQSYTSPNTFKKDKLDPGTYYYKATKTYNISCGTGQGIPSPVTKSGSFIIEPSKTTLLSVNLN